VVRGHGLTPFAQGLAYCGLQVGPGGHARQIEADALELHQREVAFLEGDAAVVGDGDEGDGFWAVLADVAALRDAGHDDCAAAFFKRALVDVPERPVVEAGGVEVGDAAGGVVVVAGRAAKAGVHQADVQRVRHRRLVARQQAVGGGGLREAHAVDGDAERGAGRLGDDRFGMGAKQLDAVGEAQFLRDPRLGVVVAADDEDADAALIEAAQLFGQETGGFHGRLVAVVEIAGEDQGIDLFVEAKCYDGREGVPGGGADEVREFRIAQGEGAQRRVEVDVGGVNKTVGHGFPCRLGTPV